MKFKKVFRYDNTSKMFRLFRLIWKKQSGAGAGGKNNYHGVFKLALSKKPFSFSFHPDDKVLTLCFVRFTLEKSYGGIPV